MNPEEGLNLGEKQRLMCKLLPQLLNFIHYRGYECTLGDAHRDERVHGAYGARKEDSYSASKSLHKLRLAIDLNLFKDGVYQTTTEAHKESGLYWKTLHPLCEWGGEDGRNDGNHYSISHFGRW